MAGIPIMSTTIRRRPHELLVAGPSTMSTSAPAAGVWGLERGLLHDDRRPRSRGAAVSIPIFKTLAPRRRLNSHEPQGRTGRGDDGRARLSPLRAERGRAFRQDWFHNGNRVRPSWPPMRKGLDILRAANVGKKDATPSMPRTTPLRNPRTITNTTSTCPDRRLRSGGAASVIASWLLDPDSHGADRGFRGYRSSRDACPIPEKAAGRSKAAIDEGVPGAGLKVRPFTSGFFFFAWRSRLPEQVALRDALSSSGGHLEEAGR